MDLLKLLASVIIDLIGYGSYALFGVGEVTDIIYAPLSAVLIYYLYGEKLFAIGGFLEEMSPGLDFIPTATLSWFYTEFVD